MEFAEFIKVPVVHKVTLVRPGYSRLDGTLCITGHHLMFSSRIQASEELMLLHRNIENVDKRLSDQGAVLSITCKDFNRFQLIFPNMELAQKVQASIEPLSIVDTLSVTYPFYHQANATEAATENGWDRFGIETFFLSMYQDTEQWRISNVNSHYQVCNTYPSMVIVPRKISDDILKKSASFRQHGRFPVLCYFFKTKMSSLLRSAQPATGITTRRCKDDEKLLNETLSTGTKGLIFDTRNMSAIYNSRSKGYGIEPDSHYQQWTKAYGNLARHKEFTDMFRKYVEACKDRQCSMSTWLTRLEACGWFKQLELIINAGNVVAGNLQKGSTVLVHGGSGKDTTLIVSSFAQVLLDPRCRTIQGFESLIVREWITSGHPFKDRCIKLGTSSARYNGQAPTFLMFLDAVHQVMLQYQCSFEFNDKFLQVIFENAYSSNFGTFLGNCEQEREKHKVRLKTISLWNHLNHPDVLTPYLNPVYEENPSVLKPSSACQTLSVWSGIFLRGHVDPMIDEEVWKSARKIEMKNKELKMKAFDLRRQYVELQDKVRKRIHMDKLEHTS
ncbi:myotubularin-related protein 9-like [Xenia sp. Carnegie-2017]|uniref:myotubularin-related protein 9-like n=1 Tax=Xenia sp. Carnegie-2017 TaxID=2897299 RepID=UPI001F04310B|nr:myotubularin-related protein 9-like [Xenia sp. Carnegie-2017]